MDLQFHLRSTIVRKIAVGTNPKQSLPVPAGAIPAPDPIGQRRFGRALVPADNELLPGNGSMHRS
jgi:hypothetical protein